MISKKDTQLDVQDVVTTLYEEKGAEQVLVTGRHIRLGDESWPVETIEAVELVRYESPAPVLVPALDQRMSQRLSVPVLLSIVGLLLIMFPLLPEYSVVFLALGALLFLLGLGMGIYTMLRNAKEVYRIRLTLKKSDGSLMAHEPSHTWDHKTPAQNTVLAVRKALAVLDKS